MRVSPVQCLPFWVYLVLMASALVLSCSCGEKEASGPSLPSTRASEGLMMAPGLYDFYGTFWDNPIYSDGSEACAIPAPLGCPSVTTFSMYKLTVGEPGPDGIQRIRGCSQDPAQPSYHEECAENLWNVAVGKVWMLP